MFDNLGKKIGGALDKIRGKKLLNEKDIEAALSEIRMALLEADVSLPVVKELQENIARKALGSEVIKSVDPAHMVIKIVQDEITNIISSDNDGINLNKNGLSIILMAGLQGAGKTTSAAKIAHFFKSRHKKKVLVASLDVNRPAAQEQLAAMAQKAEVDSLEIVKGQKVEKITKRALKQAKNQNYDILILDSAGRLSIDRELMKELASVQKIASPNETLLVTDSLTGQDAINTASGFLENIEITGMVMTRLDGDPRGGSVLSMKYVTKKPIKFIGVGEQISDLEQFVPDRIASRIMDMGDIVSLVEKAEAAIKEEEMMDLEAKLKKGEFTLNDLLAQIRNMKKMGGVMSLAKLIPGAAKLKDMMQNVDIDAQVAEQEAIILSMTLEERLNPKIINGSRKRRIAMGSGLQIQHVNKVLKKHKEMLLMMEKVRKKGFKKAMSEGMLSPDMLQG